ncbi:restriction endonuclease [Luteimonas sp. R10]|uniref:restriction endonuclease n=1 Tax=Luteimonas sp. R10 TaxID=3108176 RepID=UPI0030879EA4|nr:restriction endonuclease [Luteimonas sp. R10]
MSAGLQWLVAAVVVLLFGTAATVYVQRILRQRDETRAGIAALSGTSWREFIHLVLQALSRRGFERVFDHEIAAGDKDYTLERDGRRWLLSCKHGSAFVLGNATVNELSNEIRLANANGGFLFTQGRISDEARRTAADRNIELLDGATLWPELRDLIRPERLAAIRAGADRRARQRTALAWLLALLAGIAVYFAIADRVSTRGAARTLPAASEAQPSAPAAEPDATPGAGAADADGSRDAAPAAASPQQQRQAVASAVATLPMVDRAFWATRSTLEVHLLDAGADAMPSICPLVERYPDLAASRILLTPPADSGLQVRFRQCRTY